MSHPSVPRRPRWTGDDPVRLFGLHPRTDSLLQMREVCTDFLIRAYPDGRVERSAHPVRMSRLAGADDGVHWLPNGQAVSLRRYHLPGGQEVCERVQAFEDGGVFLALTDENGRWLTESLWSAKERARALRPRRARRVPDQR